MPRPSTERRAFALYLVARVFTALSFQMAGVAIGWLVYARTGSAYNLGLVGLAQFLPMVALTFVVGPLADRIDRRRIVATCEIVNLVTLVLLAIGAARDWLGAPAIFAAVAVLGAARAFEHPSMSALLPGVVGESELPKAVAYASSAMQTATIIGPALGGLLYAFGASTPLGLAALMSAATCIAILAIPLDRKPPSKEPVTLASVFSGLSFIWRRPVILGAISLDLFAVLLGGVTALLPIYAHDILETGSLGLGLLRSAPAVGAVAMSFFIGRIVGANVGRTMFVSVCVFGLAILVFALSRNMILSLAALAITGAADNVSVVIRQSLVQLGTPDEMRGRVSAVNSLFIGTSNQLGEFESGMVAGLFGAVAAGVIGGVGTILVALLWMRLFPDLRKQDRLAASG
ncbi:MAG: MFS transporter [Hyphomicrobiales bacterium]|nr:MFS transporter [Hyphomicrobiales bacterium]